MSFGASLVIKTDSFFVGALLLIYLQITLLQTGVRIQRKTTAITNKHHKTTTKNGFSPLFENAPRRRNDILIWNSTLTITELPVSKSFKVCLSAKPEKQLSDVTNCMQWNGSNIVMVSPFRLAVYIEKRFSSLFKFLPAQLMPDKMIIMMLWWYIRKEVKDTGQRLLINQFSSRVARRSKMFN